MSDLKKMYKIILINSEYVFKVFFSIYTFFLAIKFFQWVGNPEQVLNFFTVEFILILCILGQVSLPAILNYDLKVLKTLPFYNLNLYPLASFLGLLTAVMPYMVIYIAFQKLLGLTVNYNFMLLLINSVLFLFIYQIFGKLKSGFLFINTLAIYIVVSIFFILSLIHPFSSDIYNVIFYVQIGLIILAVASFIYAGALINPWKDNYKKISKIENYKSKKELNKLNADVLKIENMKLTKLIAYLKWTSHSNILFVYLLFMGIAVAITIFNKSSITSENNFYLMYTILLFLFIYENGSSMLSLIGLPITPRQIYITTLKMRILIIVLTSILYISAEYLIVGKIFLSSYLVQYMILLLFLMLLELTYIPVRANYEIFFRIFIILAPTFARIPIAKANTKIFLRLDFVLLLILISLIVYKIKTINKNCADLNLKTEKIGDKK
ncbi:MAG: hypothetical protein SOR77_03295 [Peptoniphilus sp.]|uniref:hypothetical protein n=1 Tax=Peptoniphilus sp. TaxID=1971214 RepID=UPI002A74AC7A|nr:hypothetical protein [Peptoniphilus sp.]MDY2986640.1 hypothetical protein [Peptoniphilus sp.]